MNKKGFAKTLEATIAIILILTFIFYFTPKSLSEDPSIPANVMESQAFILEQISTTPSLRDCLVQSAAVGKCETVCLNVSDFVQDNDNKPFGYTAFCEVCNSANTCAGDLPLNVSLYTDSVFLSGKFPKVVRIYFWSS
jgi:hypothetical protein|tara:strand:- start:24726 stop:25139 length:414 start_codon:yes stop_codon:yes gene_type:complete